MEENFQKNNKMKFVLSALFDIKPVDKRGNFDFKKIRKITPVLDLKDLNTNKEEKYKKKILKVVELKEDNSNFNFEDIQEVLTKEKILEELEEIEKSDIKLQETRLVSEPKKIVKQNISEINSNLLEEFYFPEDYAVFLLLSFHFLVLEFYTFDIEKVDLFQQIPFFYHILGRED